MRYTDKEDTGVYDFNVSSILGQEIGSGLHRIVYKHKLDDDLVIKIERQDSLYFANIMEYNLYNDLLGIQAGNDLIKYLAPVTFISKCGKVLFMRKVKPVTNQYLTKNHPTFPSVFTDLKPENVGLYKEKLVVCDYAINMLPYGKFKMREVKWDNNKFYE